jgi:hypothetical protein
VASEDHKRASLNHLSDALALIRASSGETNVAMKMLARGLGKVVLTSTPEPSAIRGTTIEKMWIDEIEQIHNREYEKILADNISQGNDMAGSTTDPLTTEAMAELEGVIIKLNEYFNSTSDPFDPLELPLGVLLGPGTLTVNTSKGYRKRNHIGGESFIYTGARIGALTRGARIIIELKPDFAAEYTTLEMTEDEAINQLDTFRQVAREAIGNDFVAEMKRIRTIDAVARDTVAAIAKMDDYKDFGAW